MAVFLNEKRKEMGIISLGVSWDRKVHTSINTSCYLLAAAADRMLFFIV